jgi:hypothetical protein
MEYARVVPTPKMPTDEAQRNSPTALTEIPHS